MTQSALSTNEFISHASHELKTPITTIKGYTDILLKLLKDQPKPYTYLTRMSHEVDRLTQLINEILDVSRLQSGRLSLSMETVDIQGIIGDAVAGYEGKGSERIHLAQASQVSVKGDRHRLTQILAILLSNALTFSQADKPVEVYIKQTANDVRVEVKDQGFGIESGELEHIFEPFYQSNDVRKRSFAGWGLGLHIAREIAKRHNGNISVSSKKDAGSTFTLTLPKA